MVPLTRGFQFLVRPCVVLFAHVGSASCPCVDVDSVVTSVDVRSSDFFLAVTTPGLTIFGSTIQNSDHRSRSTKLIRQTYPVGCTVVIPPHRLHRDDAHIQSAPRKPMVRGTVRYLPEPLTYCWRSLICNQTPSANQRQIQLLHRVADQKLAFQI